MHSKNQAEWWRKCDGLPKEAAKEGRIDICYDDEIKDVYIAENCLFASVLDPKSVKWWRPSTSATKTAPSADRPHAAMLDKYFSVQETLNERERLYGNIEDLMTLSQEIQGAMRTSKNWWDLMPAQREALQMIASKIARILNGDPNYKDNWHDIQGYARLAEERCKE